MKTRLSAILLYLVATSVGVFFYSPSQAHAILSDLPNGGVTVKHADCHEDAYGSETDYGASANTDAARGAALTAALAAAQNCDAIFLSTGTFDLGANGVDLSMSNHGSLNIHGSGKFLTVITTTAANLTTPTGWRTAMLLGTTSQVTDLSIINTTAPLFNFVIYWNTEPSTIFLKNVYAQGETDALYGYVASHETYSTLVNVTAISKWDTFVMDLKPCSTINIYDSTFTSTGNVTDPSTLTTLNNVVSQAMYFANVDPGGTTPVINVYNSTSTVQNAPFGNNGITDVGVTFNLYHSSITTSGTSTNYDVAVSAGGHANLSADSSYTQSKLSGSGIATGTANVSGTAPTTAPLPPGPCDATRPVVTGLSAHSGEYTGGNHITVIGRNFTNASTATVGNNAATVNSVSGDGTSMDITVPAMTSYDQLTIASDVKVTQGSLVSVTSSADHYTYVRHIYWYKTGANSDWITLSGNWWDDAGHTSQAASLPNGTSTVVTLGTVAPRVDLDAWTTPLALDASTTGIFFSSIGGSENNVAVTGNATFEGNAGNSNTIHGDATFVDDGPENLFATITGTAYRLYSSPATTTRNYTHDNDGTTWTVVADGVQVNVSGATYDSGTSFESRNRGCFVGGPSPSCSSTVPTLSINDASPVGQSTATVNAAIVSTNGANLTARGFEFGFDTSYGTIVSDTGNYTAGAYSANVSGLACGRTYHYRAFGTNYAGTASSTDRSFATPPCSGGGSGGGSSYTIQINAALATSTASTTTQLPVRLGNCPKGLICTPIAAPIATLLPATLSFSRDLSSGSSGSEVRSLQQYLNLKRYIVAQTGPGSPGNETAFFGQLTKSALIRFQKDHGIPSTGYFGPITRKYVDAHR